MNLHQTLKNKLEQIKRVFVLDSILNLSPDKDFIRRYYKANKLAYSFFHTFSDRVCMGISRGGKYKDSDLLEAARFVEKYIPKLNAENILDLATGRGATSAYLAEKYTDIKFDGIDLSEGQLDFARKKAKIFSNYRPVCGDYHDLNRYKNGYFDIVFIVEGLCHSQEKERVLRAVYRVLKPGGIFIIFDGYLRKNRKDLTPEESTAAKLTEKSMAVSEFENYADFKRKVEPTEFSLDYEEDVSAYIMPTLKKFEKLANIFFSHPRLAKIIARIFPKEFVNNAIAGYLMPDMIDSKIGCYFITIFRKKSTETTLK